MIDIELEIESEEPSLDFEIDETEQEIQTDISGGGDNNVIEEIKVNNNPLPIENKSVNIDLSSYAQSSEVESVKNSLHNLDNFTHNELTPKVQGNVSKIEEILLTLPNFALQSVVDALSNLIDTKINQTQAQEIAHSEVAKVIADAPEAFDTLKEIADYITEHAADFIELQNQVSDLELTTAKKNDVETALQTLQAEHVELANQTALVDAKVDTINQSKEVFKFILEDGSEVYYNVFATKQV